MCVCVRVFMRQSEQGKERERDPLLGEVHLLINT